MKKPAVFLDRDGTIIRDVHYLKSPEQVEILPEVIPALQKIAGWGWHIFIISNQSGVARGYFSEEDVQNVNRRLVRSLEERNIPITGVYYCPHHVSGKPPYNIDCECRKPAAGMVREALKNHPVDLQNSVVIGDKYSDVQLAKNLNIAGILVKTGHGKSELEKPSAVTPDFIADNMREAAEWIDARRRKKGTR